VEFTSHNCSKQQVHHCQGHVGKVTRQSQPPGNHHLTTLAFIISHMVRANSNPTCRMHHTHHLLSTQSSRVITHQQQHTFLANTAQQHSFHCSTSHLHHTHFQHSSTSLPHSIIISQKQSLQAAAIIGSFFLASQLQTSIFNLHSQPRVFGGLWVQGFSNWGQHFTPTIWETNLFFKGGSAKAKVFKQTIPQHHFLVKAIWPKNFWLKKINPKGHGTTWGFLTPPKKVLGGKHGFWVWDRGLSPPGHFHCLRAPFQFGAFHFHFPIGFKGKANKPRQGIFPFIFWVPKGAKVFKATLGQGPFHSWQTTHIKGIWGIFTFGFKTNTIPFGFPLGGSIPPLGPLTTQGSIQFPQISKAKGQGIQGPQGQAKGKGFSRQGAKLVGHHLAIGFPLHRGFTTFWGQASQISPFPVFQFQSWAPVPGSLLGPRGGFPF